MPKVVDHDERRKHIVDVTMELIVQGGLEAATMREIAAEAGFANGALKHYFASKEEIIRATYERALAGMVESIGRAVADRTGLDALRSHCFAAMPMDQERIAAGRIELAFWSLAINDREMAAFYTRHLRGWREALSLFLVEGRAAGEILTSTPDDVIIDEIMLLNSGANVMSLVAPTTSTIELQRIHLEALFERLQRP